MYQSKYYTCEEIDERLLKGYYDDVVSKGYQRTFDQFKLELASQDSVNLDILNNYTGYTYTEAIAKINELYPNISHQLTFVFLDKTFNRERRFKYKGEGLTSSLDSYIDDSNYVFTLGELNSAEGSTDIRPLIKEMGIMGFSGRAIITDNSRHCGQLTIFCDSIGHVVNQILITNNMLSEDGTTITTSHQHTPFQYERFFVVSGTWVDREGDTVGVGTNSKWYVSDYDLQKDVTEKFSELNKTVGDIIDNLTTAVHSFEDDDYTFLDDANTHVITNSGNPIKPMTDFNSVFDAEGNSLEDTFAKFKAVIKGVRSIDVIDTLRDSGLYFINVSDDPLSTIAMGVLEVFHDGMRHIIYQKLLANCKNPNSSYITHVDFERPKFWIRRFNKSSPFDIGIQKNSWGPWELIENFTPELLEKLDSIESGAQVNHTLVKDGEDGDLDISDELGFAVCRFKNGHLYVRNFRSDKVLSKDNLQIRTELLGDETGNRELRLFLVGYDSEGNKQEYGPYSLPYATEDSEGTMSAQDKRDIRDMKGQLKAILAGAKVSLSFSPAVVYIGVPTSVKVNGSITGVTAELLEVYESDGHLIGGDVNTKSVSITNNYTLTSDKTFLVKAKFSGAQLETSGSLLARHPIYCGFGSAPTVITTEANKLSARTSAAGTYKATADKDNVKYFILVPTGVAVPTKFTMGGAPYVMERVKYPLSVSGVSYTVLVSGSVYNAGANVNIIAS